MTFEIPKLAIPAILFILAVFIICSEFKKSKKTIRDRQNNYR